MILRIHPHDTSPVYAQIVQQIRFGVASGALQSGEQLPSVRELATELRINPNTVARAYRELEHAGLVETRPGAGVYIARSASEVSQSERQELIRNRLDLLVQDALRLGLSPEDLHQLLDQRLAAAQEPQPPATQAWESPP